jgi:ubiquinone/menaquinone biosynthesis C-methylase UbiE
MAAHQDFYNQHKPKSTYGIIKLALQRVEAVEGVALDLCCGTGQLTGSLAERGFFACGVDISSQFIGREGEAAQAYIVADVNRLPFAGNQAQLVCCIDSLQYFDQPDVLIAEIARLLQPGGQLILSTQNNYNLAGIKKWIMQRITGKAWSPWLAHPVENFVTYPWLLRTLEANGFEVRYVCGKQFLTALVSLLPGFIRNWSPWRDKPWRSLASIAGRSSLPASIEQSALARFAMIVLIDARKRS